MLALPFLVLLSHADLILTMTVCVAPVAGSKHWHIEFMKPELQIIFFHRVDDGSTSSSPRNARSTSRSPQLAGILALLWLVGAVGACLRALCASGEAVAQCAWSVRSGRLLPCTFEPRDCACVNRCTVEI